MLLNLSREPTGGAPVASLIHSHFATAHIKVLTFLLSLSRLTKKQKWAYVAAKEPTEPLFVMAHIKTWTKILPHNIRSPFIEYQKRGFSLSAQRNHLIFNEPTFAQNQHCESRARFSNLVLFRL